MEDVKLHLGLVQILAFSILKSARLIQGFISDAFWLLLAKPLIWVSWRLTGGAESDVFKRVNFKKESKCLYAVGKLVRGIIYINGLLSGLSGGFSTYDLLLKWNPSFPLIALKNKPAQKGKNFCINWLRKESENDWYSLEESTSFGSSDVAGHFFIVGKKLSSETPPHIEIECVWASGDERGKRFVVRRLDFASPDRVYFPPRFIVVLVEVLFSLAFATALYSLSCRIWGVLDISEYLTGALSSLSLWGNKWGNLPRDASFIWSSFHSW
jgi:hypothetical protein